MTLPIAVLDIGTTKTCAIIGELTAEGHWHILGAGVALSRGMRKGVVTDVKEATQAIIEAIDHAERTAGVTIESAYAGISGAHIQSTNSRGVAGIHGNRAVTQDDINRAMEAAEAIAVPPNREKIHAIPRGFILDGQDGVQDPQGMVGFRLEVEAHVVTGATPSMQNLKRAIESAGVELAGLVLEPIAAADAVLTAAEKEMGVVLVDIGGGTTDIAIFSEGSVAHTIILPTGGIHITNDLAVGLRTPFQAAEEIKIKYGHANPNEVPETDLIDITAFGDEGTRTIYRREMADIIGARVDEICHMILNEITRAGYDRLLPAGVVLCGGTAELTGIRGFSRGILQMPVRLGKPQHIEGFVDRVSTAAFATSVGLMQWGWQQQEHDSEADSTPQPKRSHRILEGLAVWARSLLPGH